MHDRGRWMLTVATKQTNIRLTGEFLKCAIAEIRGDDNLDKLLIHDRRGKLGMDALIKGNDAAKTGYRVSRKCALVGLYATAAQGDTTGVGVFDDDTGGLLAKLAHTFQCSISIVDIVIGERLALELLRSSDTAGFDTGLNIKCCRLMRVFTVT